MDFKRDSGFEEHYFFVERKDAKAFFIQLIGKHVDLKTFGIFNPRTNDYLELTEGLKAWRLKENKGDNFPHGYIAFDFLTENIEFYNEVIVNINKQISDCHIQHGRQSIVEWMFKNQWWCDSVLEDSYYGSEIFKALEDYTYCPEGLKLYDIAYRCLFINLFQKFWIDWDYYFKDINKHFAMQNYLRYV